MFCVFHFSPYRWSTSLPHTHTSCSSSCFVVASLCQVQWMGSCSTSHLILKNWRSLRWLFTRDTLLCHRGWKTGSQFSFSWKINTFNCYYIVPHQNNTPIWADTHHKNCLFPVSWPNILLMQEHINTEHWWLMKIMVFVRSFYFAQKERDWTNTHCLWALSQVPVYSQSNTWWHIIRCSRSLSPLECLVIVKFFKESKNINCCSKRRHVSVAELHVVFVSCWKVLIVYLWLPGLAGCCNSDLLFLWSRPWLPHCSGKLQSLQQQHIQVWLLFMSFWSKFTRQ